MHIPFHRHCVKKQRKGYCQILHLIYWTCKISKDAKLMECFCCSHVLSLFITLWYIQVFLSLREPFLFQPPLLATPFSSKHIGVVWAAFFFLKRTAQYSSLKLQSWMADCAVVEGNIRTGFVLYPFLSTVSTPCVLIVWNFCLPSLSPYLCFLSFHLCLYFKLLFFFCFVLLRIWNLEVFICLFFGQGVQITHV